MGEVKRRPPLLGAKKANNKSKQNGAVMSDGLPWFRVYTNIIDNHKMRLLAFEDRWHFIAILACKQSGLFDSADKEFLHRALAVKLGLQIPALDELKKRLADVNLVDKNWNVLKWEERQYKSDSSKERQRKYREKQKLSKNVTVTKRHGDAKVTTQDTDTDADTESDTEKHKLKTVFKRVNALGVDRQLWNEFIKTRTKLKATNTARALAQLANRAEEFSRNGEDIKQLFEEANSNGWKTIYEHKNRQQRRHSATKIASDDGWM